MNRSIYTCLLWLILPLVPLKLLWRGIKQPEYRANWAERLGFYTLKLTQPVIWLHCVSVGETRAAEPLVKALLTEYPNHQILMTHGTPTGRATSLALFGDKVSSVYLPYDLPRFVARFLTHFKPVIGIILETELWFNLLHAAKQRDISMLQLNARLSEKSALGYAKLGNLTKQALLNLNEIAAQTAQDAERLTHLGALNVKVLGNIKFDICPPIEAQKLGEQLLALINSNNRLVFLAASTRDGEEAIILEAVKELDVMTVIVPRHPQRFDAVAALLQQRGLNFAKRSQLVQPVSADVKYILGDTMGEMFNYYAACDVALIGGSLLPFGAQNLIEAMASGKPVLIGEHSFNFKQIAEIAVASGAAWRFKDALALKQAIQALIDQPQKQREMGAAGVALCVASRGATAKNMDLIRPYLA